MAKSMEIQCAGHRWLAGRAVFWGDLLDAANFDNGVSDSSFHVVGVQRQTGAYARVWNRCRTLMKWSLTGIPRNSRILNAKIRLTVQAQVASGAPDPYQISVYPADVVPWSMSADWEEYDGTNAWNTVGLKPNFDYLGSAVKTMAVPHLPGVGTQLFWDITDFVQESIDRDDMMVLVLLKALDSYELTNMYGDWAGTDEIDPPKGIQVYGINHGTVPYRPFLLVEYTEPLAFFVSNEDGSINESREVFLGVGQYRIGTVVKNPVETSYQETPAKLWVKNMLPSMTMKAVELYSPPNWATYPEPDAGNTGNGTCSDVSTSPTLTIDEQWKIEFTGATAFTVYRDSGTGDVPGGTQSWTEDGAGTVGTQYSSAIRGISFTITAGGTAFVSGDKFTFRSYKDYSITGAPTDSDHLLQICKDDEGSPDGNWLHARTAMTTLTQQVVGSNVLNVALAKYFNPSNKVKIFKRATRVWTIEYTIQSVNKTANTITLQESVSAEVGDWVFASRLNAGDISPSGTVPFWARGVSFTDTEKEEKYQYLRAQETI